MRDWFPKKRIFTKFINMRKILLLFILFCSFKTYSQIDSTYYYNSARILEHYPKSQITAEDLYDNAIKVYDSLDIIVPYELAISQAIIETSLGNEGVGKKKNNPYSINSKKGYVKYNSIKEGVEAYYFIIASSYLSCSSLTKLLNNFVNCSKRRYAITKKYETKLRKQVKIIKSYLDL